MQAVSDFALLEGCQLTSGYQYSRMFLSTPFHIYVEDNGATREMTRLHELKDTTSAQYISTSDIVLGVTFESTAAAVI